MPLKLMYITNNPKIAGIAEKAGVDRIFVDMEYIGKSLRQGGMDTVQNCHTIEDVRIIRSALKKADLLVRVNPIHEKTTDYSSSEEEIDAAIEAGADIIMLPYFKTIGEVERFVNIVNGRAKIMLLMETPEAAEQANEIVKIPGINEIHIGINDMSIGYGKTFMFELLVDGTVEKLCHIFKMSGIPYGFGGVASIGTGKLPAETIITEHYRLGSSMVILSRSFCDVSKEKDISLIREKFDSGIRCIRAFEESMSARSCQYFDDNKKIVADYVNKIVDEIKQNNCSNK
ncbi:MAG: aldolase [Salinivirgaceae bacterium]|nr:aldolase [Salinivirgaceae bacterium]